MVKIYTTPTCPWCFRAKQFFQKHNIAYQEIDVSSDLKAAQEMVRKSGQMGVPVIEVGNNIIVGFDEARLRKLLNL